MIQVCAVPYPISDILKNVKYRGERGHDGHGSYWTNVIIPSVQKIKFNFLIFYVEFSVLHHG